VIVSFRTRLFVMAAAIVVATLGMVMAVGWSSVLDFEINRLDSRLCAEARRLANEPSHGNDMPRLETDLLNKLRLASTRQLLVRFDRSDAAAGFQSAHWDPALGIDSLAWRPATPAGASERDRSSPESPPVPEAGRPQRKRGPPEACAVASFRSAGRAWRAALYPAGAGRGFVAADLAATEAELHGAVRGALMIVIPLALVLTALGAWLLASLSMRPLNRLRDAMKGMSQKAMDQRVPVRGEDREFRELIDAYNTMLERLEASFRQASRFSADAAHELRTPLTILQGRLEQAMASAEQPALQAALADMLEEVGRLATITRRLLLLSQADAGRLALDVTSVDLTELLDGLMADAQMLTGDRKLTSAVGRSLVVPGDAVMLRQLFNNLLSNAVRYTVPSGWIDVVARKLPTGVEVIFANATVPITPEDRARLFDRFYRADPAHSRSVDGTGLGLSIAREIARAHRGDLTLEPGAPDEVRLRVWLPHG
jgi:heavy metal sensor kinase